VNNIKQILEKIKDKIVIDEETGIPYNMGFNQEIERLKATEDDGASASKAIIDTMNSIMSDFGYFNRQDLIHLHRYILANAISGNFKDRARALILDSIIKEYISFTQNKKKGKTISYQSTINSALNMDSLQGGNFLADAESVEDLIKKVNEKQLNPVVLEKVASYLAKQEIDS
jgi:hypothetical protein